MKRLLPAAVLAAATICTTTSAAAYSVSLDQVTCPMETLDEEGSQILSQELSSINGKPSDAQIEKLTTAANACSAKHGWSQEDSKSALAFNIAVLSAIGLEEKLRASGVEASEFESVLDDQNPDGLQAMVDGSNESPIIDKAVEMLAAQQGDKIDEEMAGYLGAYLVQVAHTQLLAMKMIEIDE
jgi:hypothetical protein